MILLALDCALASCSVALWRDGTAVARDFVLAERGQAEALVPMIRRVLQAADCAATALDHIAVTVGPGSFTGVRVGLAAARGLALVAGCAVGGVTTTQAVAAGIPEAERAGQPIFVVIDGKRADFFVQRFDPALAPDGDIETAFAQSLADRFPAPPFLLAGNGVTRLAASGWRAPERARLASGSGFPDAAAIARLAAGRISAGGGALPAPGSGPAPLYLHPPYAKLPPDNSPPRRDARDG